MATKRSFVAYANINLLTKGLTAKLQKCHSQHNEKRKDFNSLALMISVNCYVL